jgi:Flp pilus assembly protein TadD
VREGQAEQALPDFARAIALDGNFSKAYAARGVAYEALGRADEAKADYRKSIEIELRGVLRSEYGYEKKD